MKKLIFALLLFACGAASGRGRGPVFTPADSPEIRFTGRAAKGPGGALSFDWSGSQFTFRFEGTRCAMRAADTGRNYYNVFVDGRHTGVAATSGADTTVVLAEGLDRGPHTILVQKRTEGKSVEEPFTPETENCDLAWGCVIARYFDAEYTLIAHSGQGIVRNWGDEKEVSDCTMRERMLRTFDMDPASRWDFRGCTPDIVVIKLGSNDFSTGVTPSEQAFNASYAQALDQLRAAYGEVPVLCVAPSDNTVILRYLENFLRERQDAHLHLTAMLPGITAWDRDMGANYHPNHRGHRKMAMAVIPYIATIPGWEMPDRNVE